MRSHILIALFGALLCRAHSPCQGDGGAAIAGGPFRDVPLASPAYAQFNALEPYLFTGYPDGTFSGKRSLTRYEFAVALQRMVQVVSRANQERATAGLKEAVNPRPNSPWSAPVPSTGRDPLIPTLKPLIEEFAGELKMLGAEVPRLEEEVELLIRSGASLRQIGIEKNSGKAFDYTSVNQLEKRPSAVERAEIALDLLQQEIEHPSGISRHLAGSSQHPDYLRSIVVAGMAAAPDTEVLLKGWRGARPGKLRDCVTLLLGGLGEAAVRDDLQACAMDLAMPQVLRVLAVQALGKAGDEPAIATLLRLVSNDEVVYIGIEFQSGCIGGGPYGKHYPIRRAAREALARLMPPDAAVAALVKHAVDHAVVFEKLEGSAR